MSITPTGSPFDIIRRADESGEYWSARDLMPLLGYRQWRRFEDAIDRAKLTCEHSGHAVTSHFAGSGKTPTSGGPLMQDYRLTRYSAYLIAMNGDPRKPEIAAAQTYFAVKTREAEIAQETPVASEALVAQDRFDAMRALAVAHVAMIDELARQERGLRAVEGHVDQIDARVTAIESSPGWVTSTGWAEHRQWRQTDLTTLQILGTRASKIAQSQGLRPDKVLDIHGRYRVHRWPLLVWDQAAADLGWISTS